MNFIMQKQISPNIIRQVMFLLVLVFFAIIIYKELHFLISSFLGAITLYVILGKAMIFLTKKVGNKKWLAAILLIILSIILLVLPIVWIGSISYEKIKPIINSPEIIKNVFAQINEYLLKNFKLELLTPANIENLINRSMSFVQNSFGDTLNLILNLVLMYFTFFFY